jgi:hypothetical protein
MDSKVKKVLKIWHEHFAQKENQYSEFEDSDIEYFVGCMLYNHFAFSKALDTMKTMDLSYDFLSACGNEYDEIVAIINNIEFDDEMQKLNFLQDYIKEAKAKYSAPELYLLNRLEYHVNAMAQRYEKGVEAQKVEFVNPLER